MKIKFYFKQFNWEFTIKDKITIKIKWTRDNRYKLPFKCSSGVRLCVAATFGDLLHSDNGEWRCDDWFYLFFFLLVFFANCLWIEDVDELPYSVFLCECFSDLCVWRIEREQTVSSEWTMCNDDRTNINKWAKDAVWEWSNFVSLLFLSRSTLLLFCNQSSVTRGFYYENWKIKFCYKNKFSILLKK